MKGTEQQGSLAPRVEGHTLPWGTHLVTVSGCLLFNPRLSLLLLGPSTGGHRPRLQPLHGWVPPSLLSGPRGPGCLLTLQVSLSFFHSGGLNEGFGCPSSGEKHHLPTEPPPFSQDQGRALPGLLSPVQEPQRKVCPGISPRGWGRTHGSSAGLCPRQERQHPLTARCASSGLCSGAPPRAPLDPQEP